MHIRFSPTGTYRSTASESTDYPVNAEVDSCYVVPAWQPNPPAYTGRAYTELHQVVDILRDRAELSRYDDSWKYLESLSSSNGYEWDQDTFAAQATKWAKAAVVTQTPDQLRYFLSAMVDIYNRDRATRAARLYDLGPPIRTKDIPNEIRGPRGRSYQLRWQPLKWSEATPYIAVTGVADVLLDAPPDSFHIAEYVRHTNYDPIIYARYGSWNVEVARWD